MKFTRACLVAPKKFGFFEVDEEPGEGQVLLKIASCGLCNWELNFWDGNMKLGDYPMKLGHEFAGEVVKLGPGVKRLKVGDHVSATPTVSILAALPSTGSPARRNVSCSLPGSIRFTPWASRKNA